MAVREFNGSGDHLELGIGGLGAAAYGTYGAIFKVDDTAAFRGLMVFLTSGGDFAWCPMLVASDDTMLYHGNSDQKTASAIPQGVWLTLVVRKATGTATPRFSYYNHTTTGWTHGNATGSTGDGTAPTSGFIAASTDDGGVEAFDGRIAVTAAWINAVHWSADASGDSAIEAAGLHTSLQNWVDESPDGLWPWNPTVAAGIEDMVGTADQAAIVGTTQITDDDPPGFSFELGPPPAAASPLYPTVSAVPAMGGFGR